MSSVATATTTAPSNHHRTAPMPNVHQGERQTGSVTPGASNKLAMSRALGAAFLSHQVEQLEKSVGHQHEQHPHNRGYNKRGGTGGGRIQGHDGYAGGGVGNATGNWRDRKQSPQSNPNGQAIHVKRGQQQVIGNKAGNADGVRGWKPTAGTEEDSSAFLRGGRDTDYNKESHNEFLNKAAGNNGRRRSGGDEAHQRGKDADVVVVDASVLVHALYQVKKWCKEGRDEILIVPLEALNTLDLLKKGTSPLAQRARAASRLLEAQVGSNPRIRVQRDDAFVLWDKISFKDPTSYEKPDSDRGDSVPSSPVRPASYGSGLPGMHYPSPEWVRRTICCTCWEVDNSATSVHGSSKPKVVLAVLAEPPSLSPKHGSMKLKDEALMNPVPLPISSHGKHEPRTSGVFISHWAARAGVELFEVDPAAPPSALHGKPGAAAGVGDDEGAGENRNKRNFAHNSGHGGPSRGRRPSYTGHDNGHGHGHGHPRGGLVERPPAVMAMMEMVSQPKKVIKVLARGEKLEPDS